MVKKPETSLFVPEVNIGMVGHVDHGKTTLTQALSGRWTGTHSEEIKRGITIRIGYANVTIYRSGDTYWFSDTLPDGKKAEPVRTISIVDAPGHETLMTTMISGASLMDGAILVISANDHCPQPQTREHLTALEIMKLTKIIVVQNKIDLVTPEEAKKNYQQIKAFLQGSVAEHAPIIPVSAQQGINIDALLEAIQEQIPTPTRDTTKPTRMLIARSFDVNKPGTPIAKLKGGVLGGSLVAGELHEQDEVEIKPGIKVKDAYQSLTTMVRGLQKGKDNISTAGPGGLLGVSTGLDPSLTRSDSLAGNMLAKKGTLPDPVTVLTIKPHLIDRVIGSKEERTVDPIKMGDVLLLTAGISRTIGSVTKVGGGKATATLKIPLVVDQDERIAISRQVLGRWRLIGWGEVA